MVAPLMDFLAFPWVYNCYLTHIHEFANPWLHTEQSVSKDHTHLCNCSLWHHNSMTMCRWQCFVMRRSKDNSSHECHENYGTSEQFLDEHFTNSNTLVKHSCPPLWSSFMKGVMGSLPISRQYKCSPSISRQ